MDIPAKVIIVAYYFPPLGLAGTARPLAMANFFACMGKEVTVITSAETNYPVYDQSVLFDIDKRIEIIRCRSKRDVMTGKLRGIVNNIPVLRNTAARIAAQTYFPDKKLHFAQAAIKEIEKRFGNDADLLLLTTSPPVSIHQVGLQLKQRLCCRWIADFRDIWQSEPYFDSHKNYRKRAERYLAEVISVADLITAASPATCEHFGKAIADEADYYFLPNGYDEIDFPEPASNRENFIGIYGTINYLIGVERLLEWFALLRDKRPELDLKLRHTGFLDFGGFERLLQKFKLESVFVRDGYLPHQESLKKIRSNLLNIISLTDKCDTSFIIPSKLFELLRAEPPVIAVFPQENAARKLLEQNRFENLFLIDTPGEFLCAVEQILALKSNELQRRHLVIEKFERRRQLADFVARITGLK